MWVSPFPLRLGIILGIMQRGKKTKPTALLGCKRIINHTYSSSIDFRGNHCSCSRRSTKVRDFHCGRIITTSEGEGKTQHTAKWQRVEEDVDFFHHKITFKLSHTSISLEVAAAGVLEQHFDFILLELVNKYPFKMTQTTIFQAVQTWLLVKKTKKTMQRCLIDETSTCGRHDGHQSKFQMSALQVFFSLSY